MEKAPPADATLIRLLAAIDALLRVERDIVLLEHRAIDSAQCEPDSVVDWPLSERDAARARALLGSSPADIEGSMMSPVRPGSLC
jgi:hypothetical protein